MTTAGEAARRGSPAVHAMLVISGVSLLAFFVLSFIWLLVGRQDSAAPAGFYLGAAVLFAGLMVILSLWLLSASVEPAAHARRGSELRTPAIHNSPDLIFQLDDGLRIVSMNAAAERRFGHTAEAVSGMPLHFLFPEVKVGAATPARPAERRLARPAASDEPHTSARRLAMRAGTRLSHLVQPLLGYAEIAIESLEPGHAVRADLEQIGRASARVVLLAQQLEMFGGTRRALIETIELNAFLDGLERDLRFVLEPATVLKLQESGYPVNVEADPGLTRLAVLLLACNAEEAMPPGSTICISVGPEEIRVADSGAGLPKDVRAALFQPLTSAKDAERGVGLGLHTARAAMRLQQADLELTESGESGSVLTLVFSRPAAKEDTVAALDQARFAAVSEEPAPSSRQSQGNQSP